MSTPLAQYQDRLRQELPALAERYGVHSLGIFGSYARHTQRPDSDLDVLVTFSETPSLLTVAALEQHLNDLLGLEVDLVMRDALKPHLAPLLLEDAVPV